MKVKQTDAGVSSADQRAGGNGARTQRVGASMHIASVVSLPMPQVFCFARLIAKSKLGETPLTQMTPDVRE